MTGVKLILECFIVVNMKIAQVTSYFQSRYYGSYEYFLCRQLVKLGHEVVVFTSNKESWQKETANRRIGVETEEYEGFVIHRLHSGPMIGIMPVIPKLITSLLKTKVDIIHAHDYYASSSFYGAIASRAKRVPFVLTQHNDDLPPSLIKAFLYLYDSLTLARYTLLQSGKIIALSGNIKSHLKLMGTNESKIEIIPNGINTRLYAPNQMNLLEERWGITPPVVLFVGRLDEEKGIEYLLQAFSKVIADIPEAKLVVVGRGPKEMELKSLTRNLGLPNVFFLGAVENRLMPSIYVGCEVFVLPSLREPFGNVVIEAMAAGKPVIGSYVGGIKDAIIHGVTGFHVPPKSSARMSELLIKLLGDVSLRERMGRNARERAVSVYDEELVIRKIEKVYNDLCAS
ncbi:glycosyltransferase [Candidatus Bathyarchaeota archaeon]|nr:glycosyltransferase [Candidatus Bathyarchaeota archaeon]